MVDQIKNPPELTAYASVPDILAILKTGDCTGYEITKQLKELPGDSFTWKEGSLYPVVKWLEQIKYIQYYWNRTDTLRPRKVYRLSLRGRKVLDGEIENSHNRLITLFRLWKKIPNSI